MRFSKCLLCKSDKNNRIYKIDNYYIVKCANCHLIYVDNYRDIVINIVYKNFDYKSEATEKRIRRDAIHSLSNIRRYLEVNDFNINILDVGCGRGYLLDEARYFNWITSGIDYSSYMVKYAKDVLKLNVIKGNINNYKSNNKFDIVVLNQVIEHLADPNMIVSKCRMLLKPKGLLYIATPNINSHLANIYKEKYEYFIPPEHIAYYSIDTLSKLLKNNGFTIKFINTWSYPENFAGLLKYLVKRNITEHNVEKRLCDQKNSNIEFINIKRIKYLLFDNLISKMVYKILNLNNKGTNIEIIASK
jgi:2-polyprenyl-3-methyl-5-hydroxy-6-metoxy-1,4-benzoquinol methylase